MSEIEQQFSKFPRSFLQLRDEVGKVFVGQEELVERVLICLFCGGHVLLEGMPGLGKTLLAKTLSRTLGLSFSRIQCTPDLMPADILGTNVLLESQDGKPNVQFQKGPLFANIVLADEVNRATPKTQSAFLEAMQETAVTVFGASYSLEPPFFVLATQNPIELEGTYPLPEAQLDRFFFGLRVQMPSVTDLSLMMDLTTSNSPQSTGVILDRDRILEMMSLVRQIKLSTRIKSYAIRLMLASHPGAEERIATVDQYVRYGASPRAAQCIILAAKVKALINGRYNVSCQDVREVALPALEHRIILNFKGDVEGVSREDVVNELLDRVEC